MGSGTPVSQSLSEDIIIALSRQRCAKDGHVLISKEVASGPRRGHIYCTEIIMVITCVGQVEVQLWIIIRCYYGTKRFIGLSTEKWCSLNRPHHWRVCLQVTEQEKECFVSLVKNEGANTKRN